MYQVLTEMAEEQLRVSRSKGFDDGSESRLHTSEKLMLIVDEVAEAHEELRKGIPVTEVYYNADRPTKPEGLGPELADIIIRTIQLAAALGIDIGAMVKLKHDYNVTRPYKHGKVC